MDPDVVEEAVYDLLTGDATLMAQIPGGVHMTRPPQGTAFPFLRFSLGPSPAETYTFAGSRLTPLRYQAQVVDEGYSKRAARAVLARVDVLLKDASLVLDTGTVLYCRREGFGEGDLTEEADGRVFQIVRALYLITTQP